MNRNPNWLKYLIGKAKAFPYFNDFLLLIILRFIVIIISSFRNETAEFKESFYIQAASYTQQIHKLLGEYRWLSSSSEVPWAEGCIYFSMQNIKETSQKVYDLCYSFRDESPFIRGLNYDSKYMGFSISESLATYREWLPNVR